MEENVIDNNLSPELSITPEITDYLRQGAKWGKFLAIMGFIMSGLIMVIALFAGAMLGSLASMSPELGALGGVGGGLIGGIYFLFGLLYFIPSLYLYRHSQKMKLALQSNDQGLLSESFKNYKSLYKFWGIFTVVILAFYALIFVFALFGGIASMM